MSAVTAQRMVLASTIRALGGCLRVPTEEHFDPVRAGIEDRTGVSVSRPSASARRALLPDDLRRLLSDELTLDEAVRIALLNNGRLLAKYEALDMASAEWLQMRLLPNPEAEGLVLHSRLHDHGNNRHARHDPHGHAHPRKQHSHARLQIPMRGCKGQFAQTVMGSMANILMVRENIDSYDYPGPYTFPEGTVSLEANPEAMERDGIVVKTPDHLKSTEHGRGMKSMMEKRSN